MVTADARGAPDAQSTENRPRPVHLAPAATFDTFPPIGGKPSDVRVRRRRL